VGLVHATAYTDDRQVMQYLLQRLAERGVESRLISPADLQWRDGVAAVADEARLVNVSALIRFFPAEWLPNLPRSCCWSNFFSGGRTPQCNPATALLTQSKRWPLVADDLGLALPTWLSTTPETRAPAEVPWRTSDEWVLKPALGRVGESIGLPGITPPKEWQQIARHVRWHGRHWIAQRRFEPVPMPVAGGDMYPCIGVFVIDGKASGAYGRVSRRPLIDEKAQDAAVLVEGSPVVAAGARQACYDTNRAL
jgi:glutathionylspermidine synthase